MITDDDLLYDDDQRKLVKRIRADENPAKSSWANKTVADMSVSLPHRLEGRLAIQRIALEHIWESL
jgi:hypothetical protein